MLAYILSQTSAILSSFESVKTKKLLQNYESHEHVFYKCLILAFISLPMLLFNWQLTLLGVIYIAYSIVITFFSEIFRANAIQKLEINTFALLMSFSVFLIYGIELAIGREELLMKNIIGLLIFVVAFVVFLEVKIQDFLKINRSGLLNLLGSLIIISVDRSVGKSAFSEEWLSPEVAIASRTLILVVIFYYFGRKKGLRLKGNFSKGVKDNGIVGFLKYTRELLYNYSLLFGSAIMVTLVLNSTLFITFIISGFFLAESAWKMNKLVGVVLAIIGIVIFTI